MQAPLHGLLGNPDDRGGLGVRQPLEADQVEDLPLVLREALDGPSMHLPSGLTPEAVLPGGASTPNSASTAAAGC
jgi:hypothetical protein